MTRPYESMFRIWKKSEKIKKKKYSRQPGSTTTPLLPRYNFLMKYAHLPKSGFKPLTSNLARTAVPSSPPHYTLTCDFIGYAILLY
jgi:hypothetical protein